jgi:RNA polymerase sigma-70 factor (ECF subfamily)
MEILARLMLRSDPGGARREATEDITRDALARLDRALRDITPPTARDFYRLAAAQIRLELIDLARRHDGPEVPDAPCEMTETEEAEGSTGVRSGPGEPPDTELDPSRLTSWIDFHHRVEALGNQDRELFDLLYYQGFTQPEAATVLGVPESTVNRGWIAARLRLGTALGGQLPV